jgi:hypothetical protein
MVYTFNLYKKSPQTYWKPCTHTFSPSVIAKCLRIRALATMTTDKVLELFNKIIREIFNADHVRKVNYNMF